MAFQVFISYSRKDVDSVRPVVHFLEESFVVWWDDDLVGGTDFSEDIFAKINHTQVALVFWSANAAASEWVGNESRAAIAAGSACIPVLLDTTQLPAHLANLDAADLRSAASVEDGRELQKLAQDITLHLAHTRKPKGQDIADVQMPDAGDDNLFNGLIFYALTIVAICLLWDRQNIFDAHNLFSLIFLVAAHLPLIFVILFGNRTLHRIFKSIAIGGWLSLCLGLGFILFSFAVLIYTTVTSVDTKVDALRPSHNNQLECAIVSLKGLKLTLPSGSLPSQIKAASEPVTEVTTAPSLPPAVRPLSVDERLTSLGCVASDWQNFVAISGDSPILSPPFVADYPANDGWANEVRELVSEGKYDEARLSLLQQHTTEASNLLAVLDALRLGRSAEPSTAFGNFRIAAQGGNKLARANLAICYMFGFGVPVDPIYGASLLQQSIAAGLAPEKAMWLIQNGQSMLQVEDFSEVIKSLRLMAAKGSNVARAIEGVFAGHGLAKEPCAPKCGEVATKIAESLKQTGAPALAALVEANANIEKGPDAVNASIKLFPETILRPAATRYSEQLETVRQREMIERVARPKIMMIER